MTTKKGQFLHGRTIVGERGQIVIPHTIRESLGIKPGDELVVMSRCEKIIVLPASKLEEYYEKIMGEMESIRNTPQ